MGTGGGGNGEPGGACGGRGRWTWGGSGVPGCVGGGGSGGGGGWGRGRRTWGGGGAPGGARGSGSDGSGVPGGSGGTLGSGSGASGWLRRGGSVGAVGECAVRGGSGSAAVCGTGPHRSSPASLEASAAPGGPRVVPPGTGGGGRSPVVHGSAT